MPIRDELSLLRDLAGEGAIISRETLNELTGVDQTELKTLLKTGKLAPAILPLVIIPPEAVIPPGNSKLATYYNLAHWYSPRKGKITKIAIHHMAGRMTGVGCADFFSRGIRYGSANYCIGFAGDIALSVPEHLRAWTTSSIWCDEQAVTIEVSNSATGGVWPISDASMKALIDLCVDICKRNGIKTCTYTGDKTGTLQMHKWYAATGCPGQYLGSKFPHIAAEVSKRLKSGEEAKMEPYFVKVIVDGLNIRAVANAKSQIKGMLSRGEIVKVTDVSGGWGYADGKGWISLKYTEKTTIVPPAGIAEFDAWASENVSRKGARGKLIEAVQAALTLKGHACGKIDGVFGLKTETALKAYQRAAGLMASGVIDVTTLKKILG